MLLPLAGPVAERTVRWYVARLKAAAAPKEVYVHRSPRPGVTLEVDFGESWAEVAGVLRKVTYVVATLPYSNVYFAKAYPIERLESLLDGIQAALASMGGVTDRVVLDNTTIAVKQVLTGRDRVQTDAFQAFRGAYPFAAAFCAPAKGWEKGSVETGVTYVRNLVFRPRPTVASWAALNALIITELEADVATRRLADGRPVREAWTLERRHLRAVPVHRPETCRVEARVVDKFGHGRADRVTYSVPTRYAYRPVWVKLYHDRVAVAAGTEVVARHVRAFRAGAMVLDPLHVLPVLERKHRAVPEATALQDWALAPLWQQVRTALRQQTRKPDQEWVRMLRLLETYPATAVEAAVAAALARDSPRLERLQDGPAGLARQTPRHGGAMDQGRQTGHPLDAAVVPSVPGERSAPATECPGLQPGQPLAQIGPAAAGQALVAHESPAAAGENRRPAGEACQVLLAPAGRRASDPAAVRRDAAEDLGAASAGRIAADRLPRNSGEETAHVWTSV